jgi:hypothetical protein
MKTSNGLTFELAACTDAGLFTKIDRILSKL